MATVKKELDGADTDERSCPVCCHGSLPSEYRSNYKTFTEMMRHWGEKHPEAMPSSPGGSTVGNCRRYTMGLGYLDQIVPQDNVELWADDLEAHQREVCAVWNALGYAEP